MSSEQQWDSNDFDLERLTAALEIVLQPLFYKVCEGCDSILFKKTIICPSCKSYRFNYDEDYIINTATELAFEEKKSVTQDDLY
jgi:RNA polymerase subunit RPABC4/transcription elongation factor Spt4